MQTLVDNNGTFARESSHGSPFDTAVEDRRRSLRHDHHTPAWLSPEAQTRNGKARQVMVTDLSLHGVGFIAATSLEVEGIHWMVVGAGALRASSRVRIVNCRPAPDGGYEVGGEFF